MLTGTYFRVSCNAVPTRLRWTLETSQPKSLDCVRNCVEAGVRSPLWFAIVTKRKPLLTRTCLSLRCVLQPAFVFARIHLAHKELVRCCSTKTWSSGWSYCAGPSQNRNKSQKPAFFLRRLAWFWGSSNKTQTACRSVNLSTCTLDLSIIWVGKWQSSHCVQWAHQTGMTSM